AAAGAPGIAAGVFPAHTPFNGHVRLIQDAQGGILGFINEGAELPLLDRNGAPVLFPDVTGDFTPAGPMNFDGQGRLLFAMRVAGSMSPLQMEFLPQYVQIGHPSEAKFIKKIQVDSSGNKFWLLTT